MASTLPPTDYAALVKAIDVTCGACTCRPLLRRLGHRCRSCCEKSVLLCELLAATDTSGRSTVERWTVSRHYQHILRLGEPIP